MINIYFSPSLGTAVINLREPSGIISNEVSNFVALSEGPSNKDSLI